MATTKEVIIVTTDLSEEAIEAFPTAASFAKDRGAQVLLVTVLEDWNVPVQFYEYTPPETFSTLKEQMRKDRIEVLEGYAATHFKDVEVTPRVIDGSGRSVSEEICDVARSHDASLIVLASHGKGAVQTFFLGSTVQRVLQHADVPVLVIPRQKKE